MATTVESPAQGWPRSARTSDLLVWLWRLLASAQLAVAMTGFLALAGFLAVMIPQVPIPLRGNPFAVDAWLQTQRAHFGPFTESMHRVGLFDVVHSWWFLAGLGLLAVSVCVYTADRFLSIWGNITKPREIVSDSFFDRAANRFALATPQGAGDLEAVLRGRRFQVRRAVDGESSYLFADRFAWAQLGTFVSHLALVLFLAGGLVSKTQGYTNALLIAEGTTSPIFAVSNPHQILVEVVDAVGKFDKAGAPTDYHSQLILYQNGQEVKRGSITVNKPMSYGGYRFHQAGYLGEGAALRVRDVASGNVVYDEALALQDLIPAPAVVVHDAQGAVVLDDVIVPTDFVGPASGTLATVSDGRQFWVGVAPAEHNTWQLVVYDPKSDTTRLSVEEGSSGQLGGLSWTFRETTGLPSITTEGVPGDHPQSLVVLSNTGSGGDYLTVLGPVDGRALTLYPNQPVRVGEREYVFAGRREFAGIEVRRDPGAKFIWIAAGLLIAGLMMSFYIPRLRLWVRVRGGETVIAGPAERSGAFQTEMKRLTRDLDAAEKGPDG